MFTKESFEKVQCTDIPREVLLPGVLEELIGREMMIDTYATFDERLYMGDVFEAIAGEWAELKENDKQILRITQEDIDQVNNLSEVIDTELVRIIN